MNQHVASIRVKRIFAWDLIRGLEQGEYALPRLQREFVWNGKQAVRLLDSIDKGLPVGSILVWETDAKNATWLQQSEQDLFPSFSHLHRTVRVVIDGQQRLTVLYQAYKGDKKKNAVGRDVDFLKVVLALRDSDRKGLHFAYRREQRGAFIAVPHILARHWMSHCNRLRLSKRQIALVRKTRERLRSYPVLLILFKTTSLINVAEAFIRINTGGQRLSSADEVLANAQKFSLRQHVRSLQRSLDGMERLPANTLLHGFCFFCGKKRVDKTVAASVIRDWEFRMKQAGTDQGQFGVQWNAFAKSVQKAANLLRKEFCVYSLDLLPSDNMLATLPIFYARNDCQDPSPAQLKKIRQWFWATAAGNRYTGAGYRRNIESDVLFFEQLAKKPAVVFSFAPTTSAADLRRTVYMGHRSLAKAVFCLLAMQEPVNLKTGAKISIDAVSGMADKKNKHHIFPRALLREKHVGSLKINSVVNICFLPFDLNINIGKKAPYQYLQDYKPKAEIKRRLRTHLIPSSILDPPGRQGLQAVYRSFLKERSVFIARKMREAAGIALFTDEE